MPTEPSTTTAPRPRPHGLAAFGLILALASAFSGCARDRNAITPTTTGTDFSTVPRGRMVPQPFPGSSLANRSLEPERRTPPDGPILTGGSSDAVLR